MIIDRSIGSIGSMIVGLRRLWKERAKKEGESLNDRWASCFPIIDG